MKIGQFSAGINSQGTDIASGRKDREGLKEIVPGDIKNPCILSQPTQYRLQITG
ncbi:hypothetical protein [Dysgonomonas termitidis]|uniref:Uncharacterized protein n=1 Tax=Dysgonomonas termitidis TaxID=1516126 RepID=A0ABV9KYL5_9BACT